MQTARWLVFTLLAVLVIIAPALAESSPHNETPSEVRSEINSTASYTPAAAPPASLPDAPAPQTVKVKVIVIDKKFIAVMAALGGAESLRFTTHKLVLDHEFAAGAPWVTSVPANPHLVAKGAAIYAAELLVAYELKKPHSWLPGDKGHPKTLVDVSRGNDGDPHQKWRWQHPNASSVMHRGRVSIAIDSYQGIALEIPQALEVRASSEAASKIKLGPSRSFSK